MRPFLVEAGADTVPAAQLPALRLKRNEDRRLQAGHLWVFSNEVETAQTPLTKFEAGELVRVIAHNDRALGLAYVNPQSLICARLLESWHHPDVPWFVGRIRTALALRERLYAAPYYRVVYGESDGLPGLVVDRFGDACVAQIGTAGMERLKPQIQQALKQALGIRALLYKNDSPAREMEGLPSVVEQAVGELRTSARSSKTACGSRHLCSRARKRAGFSIKRPIGAPCRSTCVPARACSMSSATSVPGDCAPPRAAPARCCASTARRPRSNSRRATPKPMP